MTNDMMAMHYFVQFGASGLGICTSAFVMSQVIEIRYFRHRNMNKFILFQTNFYEQTANYLFIIVCFIGLTMQIYIPCYFAANLLATSERLVTSGYASNWIEQTRCYKATMILFTERIQKPFLMRTYMGVFEITLPTLVFILRTAYSMLSTLTQMA